MPRGRYSLHDPHDGRLLGEEHFQCAAGPSGWRYTAQVTDPSGEHNGSVDLTTDARGRPLRLELHAGSWRVRGGALDGVTWVRTDPTGADAQEGSAAAHAFTGASPGFLVATARLLHPQAGGGAVRARLVALTPPVLAPRTLDQAWELAGTDTHSTDSGPLVVHAYRVTEIDTGEQQTVHLAGDVVLAAPGVELEELDSPPTMPG
jgi:hypothetical protein